MLYAVRYAKNMKKTSAVLRLALVALAANAWIAACGGHGGGAGSGVHSAGTPTNTPTDSGTPTGVPTDAATPTPTAVPTDAGTPTGTPTQVPDVLTWGGLAQPIAVTF